MRNRVFRCLVCFALICCILVNCSPIRVHASAVIAGAAITGTGVFATLFSMAMGVVFVDLTADLINGIGQSFEDHITSKVGTDETEILKVWIEPLQVDLDSGGISQLPPDQDDDNNTWATLAGLFSIPEELLDNFLDWGKALINGETEVEVANPENIEVWTTSLEFEFGTNGFTYSYLSNEPFGVVFYQKSGSSNYTCCVYNSSSAEILCKLSTWNSYAPVSFTQYGDVFYFSSSFTPCDSETYSPHVGILEGSSFSVCDRTAINTITGVSRTIIIEPSIYVGDIPQQVQDDTFDEEKYELPYINYTQLFQNQTDAIDALNNVATQLQNQTMTYEEYMEQVKTPSSSGGSGFDTDVDTGTDSDTDTGNNENEVTKQLSDLTLDLSDYFPFCIPFDLYDFFACLNAEPEAPVISWEIPVPGGEPQELEIDLSVFDEVAQLLRRLQLLLFCVGLAFKTRDLIKG